MVDKVNNVNGAYEQRNAQKRPETGAPEKKEIQNIFDELDAMDGKKDGFISADIWNKYADEHGGKHIKSRIGAKNAMASIEIYRERSLDRIVGDGNSSVNFNTTKRNRGTVGTVNANDKDHGYPGGASKMANDLVNIQLLCNRDIDSKKTETKIDSKGNQTNTYYNKKGEFLYSKTENFKTKEVKILLQQDGSMGMIGKYDQKTNKIVCHTYFIGEIYAEL